MKTRETTPGKTYSVHTSSGCTVSDKKGWSKSIVAPDGYFTAHAGEVTIDGDDEADIREVFKLAPYQKLRLLGVVGGNDGLPAGYRKLYFLESAGRQHIYTGFTSATVGEIVLDAQSTSTRLENNGYAGAGTSWNASDAFYIRHQFYAYELIFIVGTYRTSVKVAHFTRMKIRFSKTRAVINGQEIALNADTFVPSSVPFFLFQAGNVFSCSARIFSAQLYDTSNQLVCDFQPCIAPDGKLGMYNKVDGTVKKNAGSDEFIAGLATVDDVLNLWLPETGGKLTVSVPADTPDSAVEQLSQNNPTWEIAIQFRTDDNEN